MTTPPRYINDIIQDYYVAFLALCIAYSNFLARKHGKPRDTAVNFDTYEFLQRNRAVSLHSMAFVSTSETVQMLKLLTVR